MNTKKWLTLGLSVALAATAALAACAPTQPNDPNAEDPNHTHTFTKWDYSDTEHWKVCPKDGEIDVSSRAKHTVDKATHTCECGYAEAHTHSYTGWEHDADQHWKVCPDDGAVDPDFPKADHSFDGDGKCECGYTLPEVYIEGLIASHPTSKWYNDFRKAGDLSKLTTACIKMTRSEDGKTYTAEVYLKPTDEFAVYDYAAQLEYPGGAALQPGSKALRVTEANTYLVSWEVGSETPTFRVHDHKFADKYDYNGTDHWKVCTDQDATPDTTRTPHEFHDGSCVCGAKQACEHTNGSIFKYTEATLPEASAEGGTLKKYCPDCGEEVTEDAVNYTKVGQGTTAVELAVGEVMYARGVQTAVSVTAEQAGTYGFRLENVLVPEGFVATVRNIDITDPGFSTSARTILDKRKWATSGRVASTTAKWKEKITFDGGSPDEANVTALKEIKFTVTEEDVAKGACTLTVVVDLYSTSTNGLPVNYPTCGIVITAFSAPAAASSAPAEVAMLPERKD